MACSAEETASAEDGAFRSPKKAAGPDGRALEKHPTKQRTLMPSQKAGKNESLIPADVLDNKASEIGRFWSVERPLKAEAQTLLYELLPFYTDANLERLIVPRALKSLGVGKEYVLTEEMCTEINGISLRAIEWLVTNYSKGTKIVLYNERAQKRIDIHNAYEIQSNYYKRHLFDPFCRHGRVYFTWTLTHQQTQQTEEVVMMTTVGQLNFMKWADEHGILDYARRHQDQIQRTMEVTLSQVNREKKLYKKLGKTRKRKELTKEPEIYCTVYSLDTRLYFDPSDSAPAPSPSPSPPPSASPPASAPAFPT